MRVHPQSMACRAARAGFSTVELILSLAVVLVIALAWFGTQFRAHRTQIASFESDLAMSCLRSTLDDILGYEPTELLSAANMYSPGATLAPAMQLRSPLLTVTYPGFAEGDPAPPVLPIVLTLGWTGPDGRLLTQTLRSAQRR